LWLGSGASTSNDLNDPWLNFHKSNDAELFLISILKALESLKTFRSGEVGLSLIIRKTGASGRFKETIRKTHI
jgi:hypothetical protein